MLYVETTVRAPLERVWQRSREPAAHERWDLRFSRIEPAGPDGTFRYTTHVLPGLTVEGHGVSAGERLRPDGSAASVLRFASADSRSLVRVGTGFWRFLPTEGGTRLLTGYEYAPGWGRIGDVADRAFRPLFGWATAWSFDRLRLWLELDRSPERSRNQALAELAMRLGTVWAVRRFSRPVPKERRPEERRPEPAPSRWHTLLALGVVLAVPPLPGTPAARRCRRSYRASPQEVARWARR